MIDLKARKCQKYAETEENVDDVDRLSLLGDAFLSHILSLLPTKDAVKTSVLSKRWKYVWTKSPVLDFPDLPNNYSASDIDRVLHMNNVKCLKKFTFSDLLKFDLVHITSWIANLNVRHIEEVELNFFHTVHDKVPINLLVMFLTGVQPEILRIFHGAFMRTPFPAPLAQFSKLKFLHLTCVQVIGDDFMNGMLTCCPVLEKLFVSYCGWYHMHVVSSTLKHLSIDREGKLDLVIEAPYIQQLHILYGHRVLRCRGLDLMKCLVNTEISAQSPPLQLLQDICGTKTLQLRNSCFDESVRTAIADNQLVFSNLTHLDLQVTYGALAIIPGILRCCPNLVSFAFDKDPYWDISCRYCKWISPSDVPRCLLWCLKTVNIQFRVDDECDECLHMVKYLLTHSQVMKEMEVKTFGMDSKKEIKVLKELLKLPRASLTCQVIFTNEAGEEESKEESEEEP